MFSKRFKQLIKPYSYTCIAVVSIIGMKNILKFFIGKETGKTVIKAIIRWVYASFYGAGTFHDSPLKVIPIGAIWFLLAVIWGTFMTQYARTKKYPIIWIIGIALVGYFSSEFIWLPWSIQAAMTAVVFIYMGTLLREKDMLGRDTKPLFAVSLLIWINEIIHGNPNLSIVRNFHPNGIFDFMGGAGAVSVILIARYSCEHVNIKQIWNAFQWLGKNSLTILCLHLIELNTMPWERIFWQFSITQHLFIPVVLLKIVWAVGGTFLIEKYKVFYKGIADERTKHKEKFRI